MTVSRYAIISPVRNEAKYLGSTIESIRGQKLRPAVLVIVDDGSNDGTAEIAKAGAAQS